MIAENGRFKFAGKDYGLAPLPISVHPGTPKPLPFGEALDALRRAGDQRDIVAATASATKSFGFDTFTYGCLVPRISTYPLVLAFTTLSEQWMLAYHQLGYADKDPRVYHVLNESEALCWSVDDYREQAALTGMLEDMEREGLCAGATFPLHFHVNHIESAGMLSLNSIDAGFWRAHGGETLDIVGKGHILANCLNKRLLELRIIAQRQPGDDDVRPELLTPREKEMLQLMWRGDTDKSVARQLRIEHTTVRRHVDSVKAKLCAGSKAEMLSIAREMGICGSGLSAYIRVLANT